MNLDTIRSPLPVLALGADLGAIKARQQATWASGDFAVIGTTLQIVGESLCEAVDLCAGERVLDVACGNGNATLAAARRWARVTGADYVPELLAKARQRARAEGLSVELCEADAEALPFGDAAFDVVLSTFGVMFAPDQVRAAGELARVCRSGGRIGLANWTPEGFIGQVFKILGTYVPPAAGLRSPALWGTPARLEELFRGVTRAVRFTRRTFNFRYRSPQHFLEVFRTYYGPMATAFATLDEQRQAALTHDLLELMVRLNAAQDGTLVVPSEYLEVVIDVALAR